jgi:hypothetical protein
LATYREAQVPDWMPLAEKITQGMLVILYLWMVWTLTKDWGVRVLLALFVVSPPQIQTLLLACAALNSASVERARNERALNDRAKDES